MDGERSRERLAVLRALGRRTDVASLGPRTSPAVAEAVRVFGGEQALLLAVHYQWQASLLARLDQVLETPTNDVHGDVLRAVEAQGRALPGFATLLREHADDPALDRARRRLADYVDQACPCGRPHPLVPAVARERPTADCLRRHVRAITTDWRRIAGQLRAGHSPCGLKLGRA